MLIFQFRFLFFSFGFGLSFFQQQKQKNKNKNSVRDADDQPNQAHIVCRVDFSLFLSLLADTPRHSLSSFPFLSSSIPLHLLQVNPVPTVDRAFAFCVCEEEEEATPPPLLAVVSLSSLAGKFCELTISQQCAAFIFYIYFFINKWNGCVFGRYVSVLLLLLLHIPGLMLEACSVTIVNFEVCFWMLFRG